MTQPDSPPRPAAVDALSVIRGDLDGLQSEKRRHFVPALIIGAGAIVFVFLYMGLRPDLLQQPPWQVGLQLSSWVVCLLVFPAIGVGLWFPGRGARLALAGLGIGLSFVAALGWPASPSTGMMGGPCVWVMLGTAVVLVGIGALSGAFAQRRAWSAVYWVAAGIGLAGLNVATWMCPMTAHDHVVATHMLPAVGLIFVAVLVGVVLRRGTMANA